MTILHLSRRKKDKAKWIILVIEKDHKGIIKEDFIRKLNRKNRSKAQDLEKKRQFNDIYTIYL